MNHGQPLIFGEALLDCFPDGREILGGAPFNVAWNLKAFGQDPVFISRVGEDPQGFQIKDTMSSWEMNTDFLQLDPTWPTGKVEISLSSGEPRFDILPNQAYDHISSNLPEVSVKPAFLYHGSLALRDIANRATLADLKQKYPCPVFIDINLRKPWWNKEEVLSMITGATWLKLNDDECRTLFPDQPDLHSSCTMILDQFNLEAVFLTLGKRGAIAFSKGTSPLKIEPSSSIEVVDTVGAGDAFSSVLLLGIIQEWPLQKTIVRAQEFASAIVGQRGAILQDSNFYTYLSDNWLN